MHIPDRAAGAAGGFAAEGEEEVNLAALYRSHHGVLVRLAWAVTGDYHLAEDLTQEAFVKASRTLSRLRDPDAAGAYLRSTVINLSRNSLRRRMVELRHRVSRVDRAADTDQDGRLSAVSLLRQLPPRQRACLFLRYFEDHTEVETAKLLGVSTGTVKSQTFKALRKLQELMGDSDD